MQVVSSSTKKAKVHVFVKITWPNGSSLSHFYIEGVIFKKEIF